MKILENPRWEDFDWEPLPEDTVTPAARYSWLGCGKTYDEFAGVNLANYLPVVEDRELYISYLAYAPIPKYGTPQARKEFKSWGT